MARRKLVQSLQPKISLAQSFPYVYKREIFSHRTTSIDWENFFSQEKSITFSQWNGKGGRRSSRSLSIPERNKEKAMCFVDSGRRSRMPNKVIFGSELAELETIPGESEMKSCVWDIVLLRHTSRTMAGNWIDSLILRIVVHYHRNVGVPWK